MLDNSMIPPVNSNLMHCLILRKNRAGEVIKDWKNEDRDGSCRQCDKVIKELSHIFECEAVKESGEL